MNESMKFKEIGNKEFILSNLAKGVLGKEISITNLDKPLLINRINDSNGKMNELKDKSFTLSNLAKNMKTEFTSMLNEVDRKLSEYEIYKEAGLKKEIVNGRECHIRLDIDYNQKDDFGKTNLERMHEGKSPINKFGEKIELHHNGQKMDSPLMELTTSEHRGQGNDTILHNKNKESEIDRNRFNTEKSNHWKARAEEIEANISEGRRI